MRPLAEISNLSVLYGQDSDRVAALREIDLSLFAGDRLAVIGESGSGKSTLARAIAGLLPKSAIPGGKIEWPGRTTPPLPGPDIGYVFQDPAGSLNPVLSIGRTIAEVVEIHRGLSRGEAIREAVALLDRVRLPEPDRIARAYPHQLSGGQKQRAAIAAAIAGGPSLLIADEATSALDTIVQAEIVSLIRSLVEEAGMTLLFISHDIALASGLAERIAVLRNGRLVELGGARDVVSAPADPYTKSLIDAHLDLGG